VRFVDPVTTGGEKSLGRSKAKTDAPEQNYSRDKMSGGRRLFNYRGKL